MKNINIIEKIKNELKEIKQKFQESEEYFSEKKPKRKREYFP